MRASDPEHLSLHRLLELLPPSNHFEVIQFPLNFAEPQALLAGHADQKTRATLTHDEILALPTLLQLARKQGLATLTNRPLDGLYQELPGVLRFASQVPLHGELQAEDADALEEKLTAICAPHLGSAQTEESDDDLVTGDLAPKTVKVLASLADVDCVLVGMRRQEQVAGIVRMLRAGAPIPSKVAIDAIRAMHSSIGMWFCMAAEEADHGTAKNWRLPGQHLSRTI